MNPIQAAILGLIQGLTEFIPVSSSAHLILSSYLLGWEDQGLAFDMAVHAGSLVALVIYLRHDLVSILRALLKPSRETAEDRRLGLQLIVATVPVAAAGLLLQGVVAEYLRNPLVVACSLIVFGLLMWAADAMVRGSEKIYDLSWSAVLFIGCAQALALVPGTSRSGVTITAALLVGLARTEAARFSFLLAVPALSLVAGKTVLDLSSSVELPSVAALATGFIVSAISAYLAVEWLLRWLRTRSVAPFAAYRVILGLVILVLYLG